MNWIKTGHTVVGVCLIFLLLSCDSGAVTTINSTTTTIIITPTLTQGLLPDVKVGLHPLMPLTQGISLENITVRADVWDEQQRVFVSGELYNETDQNLYAIGSAKGYDVDWEVISLCVSPGRFQFGYPMFYVPLHAATSFEFIMEWAEGLHYMELGFYSITEEEYLESTEPSEMTPVPESEITRITFSLEWILEHDLHPEPTSVKISFPAKWLEEPPVWAEGSETVELVQPTESFENSNMSTDPEVITIIVPASYFVGYPES